MEAPANNQKRFPIPWVVSKTLENIKRVADFWCCGDCDRARVLPDGLYMAVLAHVLIKEEGESIAHDEAERERKREDKFKNLGK